MDPNTFFTQARNGWPRTASFRSARSHALWKELRHALRRVATAIPCHRAGYDRHNIHTLTVQISYEKRETKNKTKYNQMISLCCVLSEEMRQTQQDQQRKYHNSSNIKHNERRCATHRQKPARRLHSSCMAVYFET